MTMQKDAEGAENKFLHDFADFRHKRVLEIGCGEGRLTRQFAHASSLTVGLDTDPDALRVALIDSPHDSKHKVTFTRAQAEHLPFSKNKFDLAIFAWSF
ncbi:MAG: class I SAM-dependent methyltransferase [Anaerolineales bacterium]|nr:class I SAM-dependent methyltransferase [Anaerolineales bacterium]